MEYTDLLFFDLINLLTLQQDIPTEHPTPDNAFRPCWIDSIVESQLAFEEVVEKLTNWHKTMSEQIYNLRDQNTSTRVRVSGNYLKS